MRRLNLFKSKKFWLVNFIIINEDTRTTSEASLTLKTKAIAGFEKRNFSKVTQKYCFSMDHYSDALTAIAIS